MKSILGKYFTLEQIKAKHFGNASIVPIINMNLNESIFEYFSVLYKLSPDIKTFLPKLDLSTPKETASVLTQYGLSTHMGLQIPYVMCHKGKPIGFIIVNTPDYNQITVNFPHWTVDCCVFVPFAGCGYMSSFTPHLMAMLKHNFNIDEFYAIVDQNNHKCISLLSKFPFDEWCDDGGKRFADFETGNYARIFCCKLSTINFVKQ